LVPHSSPFMSSLFTVLAPDIDNLIQYRVVDTLVGALLSFLANYFYGLRGICKIPVYLEKSIEANRNYLKQISYFTTKELFLHLSREKVRLY
jgi:hypothetical protein